MWASAARFCASVGGGISRTTRSCAVSFNTPAGVPSGRRSIVPAGGSLVSAVIPASFRAAELATP